MNPSDTRTGVMLLFIAIATIPADAGFVGNYALANFTLTNTNADGSATPGPGASLVLTGGNNGSDLPGTTDLVIASSGAGVVSFDYSYSSLDFPGFDKAGYLLAGFTQLADSNGASGSVSFLVGLGQTFGFRVATIDNTGEPGILTVSNFNAPPGPGAAVPEPSTFVLTSACIIAAIAAVRRYGRALKLRRRNQ